MATTYPYVVEDVLKRALQMIGVSGQSSSVDPENVLWWYNEVAWEFQMYTDYHRERKDLTFTTGTHSLVLEDSAIETVKLIEVRVSGIAQDITDYARLKGLEAAAATNPRSKKWFAVNHFPKYVSTENLGAVDFVSFPALAGSAEVYWTQLPPRATLLGDKVYFPITPIARGLAWKIAEVHKPTMVEYCRGEFFRLAETMADKLRIPGAAEVAGAGGWLESRS